MAKEETKEKKEEVKYIVSEIPTQTAPAVVDTEKEEVLAVEVALAKILNNQEEILKKLN
jgi:Asp/Glu/hydantoin racemase